MSKYTVLWGLGCLLLLGLLGGGGYWYWQRQIGGSPNESVEVSGDLSKYASKQTVSGATSTLAENNTATPLSTTSGNVPNPSEFAQYDKYKNDAAALFGDIKVGEGKEVGLNTKVAIYYKGYLTNGTLFDETKAAQKNGPIQAFNFTEGKHDVIIGMEQSIYGMKVGGKRRLIIPPKVGYGSTGQGNIPADSVLIFDVELIAAE